MEEIFNLISVLEAEEELYKNLHSILKEEVDAIIGWQIDNIVEIGKRKNILYCKESLLEEARKNFLKKISEKYNVASININNLAELLENKEQKGKLSNIRKSILAILEKIQLENTKIKILYKNNIKIIDEFFNDIGIKEYPTYAKDKKMNTVDSFTFIKNI
jgi:flagellar biosynthesis/type III secretory pathway chaperone